MIRSVAAKMGVREGARCYFLDPPDAVVLGCELPVIERPDRLSGGFDLIVAFLKSQKRMRTQFGRLRRHLQPGGALWICWPKNGQLGTDLSLARIIAIGYDGGLVESTALAIDATWSAIKFTHPKPGKVYANSFGRLPDQ